MTDKRGFFTTRKVGLFLLAAVQSARLAVGTTPQSPTPVATPTFGEQVEVTVVNVDVYVRDRQGRPVEGLTADDFRVTQDGREVEVTNFAVFSPKTLDLGSSAPEMNAPDLRPATSPTTFRPIYVVLYIDNVNLNPLQRNNVLIRMNKFVQENLAAPIQMMVVSSDAKLKIRQPFTDDPRPVRTAMEEISRASGWRFTRDRERRRILETMAEIRRDVLIEDFSFYRNTELLIQQNTELLILKQQMKAEIRAFAEFESHVLQDSLSRLHGVIDVVKGIDGRKSVIYVSNGLPMTPGLGLMHQFAEVFRDPTIYTSLAEGTFAAEFTSLTEEANRYGVSFYALDATGLGPLEGFEVDAKYVPEARSSWVHRQNELDSLTFMADTTAGLAIINTNDVSEGLELIRDDLFSYYSVGYTISAGSEDTVHEIEVMLPGYPNHEIRHRTRFVEKNLQTRIQDRVSSMLSRIVEPEGDDRLRLTAGTPVPAKKDLWSVPMRVSIPLADVALTEEAGHQVGHLEIFFGARDSSGRQVQPEPREYEVRIPSAEYQTAEGQRYAIVFPMLIRQDRHAVAVGVLDLVTNQAVYGRVEVNVP
ncbi:MAG: VWA domain-containing protein [Acidobacteria bacterium]|nr:VWA domain-containing protein [Acidobacteriota bacterium]